MAAMPPESEAADQLASVLILIEPIEGGVQIPELGGGSDKEDCAFNLFRRRNSAAAEVASKTVAAGSRGL